MKVSTSILSVLLFSVLALTLVSAAENTRVQPQVVEPKYAGEVYLLSADGQLISLENQAGRLRLDRKAGGLRGALQVAVFEGDASPFRIKDNPRPEFVVKLQNVDENPKGLINIDPMVVGKKDRTVPLVKVGTVGFGAKSVDKNMIELNVTEYGEHSFKFSPAEDLPAGEYVISTKVKGSAGYLFGRD